MSLSKWVWIISGLCFVMPVLAQQRLVVEADSVEFDQQTRLSHYQGDVRVHFRNIILEAERLEVRHGDRDVSSIQAWGSPARFQKKRSDGKLDEGAAQQIYYDVSRKQVLFTGNVEANYQEGRMRGESLSYDLVTERMQAQGGKGSANRVHIEIETDSAQ